MMKFLGPVPVPADRSVRLDESAAIAVDRLPWGREPSAARTIGPSRLRFSDDQPAPPIGRQGKGTGKQVSPRGGYDCYAETLLAWHRRLIAPRYDRSGKRGCR